MSPLPRRTPTDDAFPELDARLRAEASAARREPPPALRLRILAALRTEQEARDGRGAWPPLRIPRALRLAAAALVVAFGVWVALRPSDPRGGEPGEVAGGQDIVRPLHRLLHPEAPRVLAEADHALVAEAQALWSDTSTVARGIVRRLPMAARLTDPFAGPSPGVQRR